MASRRRSASTTTGCGRCRQPGGCGGHQAGRLFCQTPRTFSVPNPDRRQPGERVQIVLAGGSLGRSALHAYVQPLLALLAGALSGSAIAGEAGAIGGAIAGLLLGWLLLRRAQSRWQNERRCSHRSGLDFSARIPSDSPLWTPVQSPQTPIRRPREP
jgi:sigma-E factor negative regulatory protein RseC